MAQAVQTLFAYTATARVRVGVFPRTRPARLIHRVAYKDSSRICIVCIVCTLRLQPTAALTAVCACAMDKYACMHEYCMHASWC